MNYMRITLLAITLIMTTSPAFAAPSALGVAGKYNGFFFGDFNVPSADTEGRLAVGGNAYIRDYDIGSKIPAGLNGANLVVRGNLDAGGVLYGDGLVGGTARFANDDYVQRGSIQQSATMPFSFAAEENRLKYLSTSLSKLEANGKAGIKWSSLKLRGNNRSLQIFNVTGAELLESTDLDIKGIAQGATVLFNVSGETAGFEGGDWSGLSKYRNNVLFNFYEATTLNLRNHLQGSILAPFADVIGTGGTLEGALIAGSFTGQHQLNNVPFTGDLPTPTPIPGSLVLLGTGLAGLLGWKKRRSA